MIFVIIGTLIIGACMGGFVGFMLVLIAWILVGMVI